MTVTHSVGECQEEKGGGEGGWDGKMVEGKIMGKAGEESGRDGWPVSH